MLPLLLELDLEDLVALLSDRRSLVTDGALLWVRGGLLVVPVLGLLDLDDLRL